MENDVPCRKLTLLTLIDDEEVVVCENIPQPLYNSLVEFVIFQNRLFKISHQRDLEDGTQGYAYFEEDCLVAGCATFTAEDLNKGIELKFK